MDTLSHAFWAGAAGRMIEIKTKRRVSVWWSAFWGAVPDLVAFVPSIVFALFGLLNGSVKLSDFGSPENSSADFPFAAYAEAVYNFSHSLVIFALVFVCVWLIRRLLHLQEKNFVALMPFPMLGWLLHILLDIPTHTAEFYPTPIFYPISDWKFLHGFSWGQPWFMSLNIAAILLAMLWFRKLSSRKKVDGQSQNDAQNN